jgi:hypothetical protein
MHDPMAVAHCIVRPWPQRTSLSATGVKGDGVRWRMRLHHQHTAYCLAHDPPHPEGAFPWWKKSSYSRFWRIAGRDYFWPPLITVWHREPGGHDSGEVCPHTRRVFDEKTHKWQWVPVRRWRWHVWHWRIQVHPYQSARRRLLTRCAWCGGRSRKGDYVNVSHSWNGLQAHWWQGERGLYHLDCSSVEQAHRTCGCPVPSVASDQNFGNCRNCGKFRPYGFEPDEAHRLLNALPTGSRIPVELRPALERAWKARAAK